MSVISKPLFFELKQVLQTHEHQISMQNILQKINLKDYSNIIQWILMNAENASLSHEVKYKTRYFFDKIVVSLQFVSNTELIKFMLVCLKLAIYSTQNYQLSQIWSFQKISSYCHQEISEEQFLECQALFLPILLPIMYCDVPMNYIQDFKSVFASQANIEKCLPNIIQLAINHPQSCDFTAKEIFFGSALSLFYLKDITLGQEITEKIDMLIEDKYRIQQVKLIICGYYAELLNESGDQE